MTEKEIMAIICVVVGGTIAIVFAINAANNMNRVVEQAYNPQINAIQGCAKQINSVYSDLDEVSKEHAIIKCAGIVQKELNTMKWIKKKSSVLNVDT